MRESRNIYLVGLMGAGKTTVGRQLARRLGKAFYDCDQEIEARTGKDVWDPPQRLAQGTYSASPVVADGKLYVINESGTTSVVRVDGDFELLAENQLDGYTLSSFAISDGRLFLRTDKFLYCLGQ